MRKSKRLHVNFNSKGKVKTFRMRSESRSYYESVEDFEQEQLMMGRALLRAASSTLLSFSQWMTVIILYLIT